MEFGPGMAALAVLFLSLAAKLYMSFAVRAKQDPAKAGYEALNSQSPEDNASKAQFNVVEYEGVFMAVLLFLHIQKSEGLLVTIVSITVPIGQAIYFWGRALSGGLMPWAPLGTLPRYACLGIMIYLLGCELFGPNWADIAKAQVGPGVGALGVLIFSLLAKLYISFAVRIKEKADVTPAGKERPGETPALPAAANAGKAQLNVAEYEGVFMAVLLALHLWRAEGTLVTIVSITVPIGQAIYFWGRALSGQVMPWAPLGTLPRYACLGIMIYLLGNELFGPNWADIAKVQVGPGVGALGVLVFCLAAKLYMSFAIRVKEKAGEEPAPATINASKAQLNVAEYEGVFMAVLLFFHFQKAEGMLVTIVSITVPVAQAIYFFGRALSGQLMPWAPLGTLPRYACLGIMIYILYTQVQG